MEDFILPSIEQGSKNQRGTLKGLSSNLIISTAYLFGLMWSTLAGWLQHLPALTKLFLKFSFPHNF
jgi:hypothetical protein